jgi:hypothetical protein
MRLGLKIPTITTAASHATTILRDTIPPRHKKLATETVQGPGHGNLPGKTKVMTYKRLKNIGLTKQSKRIKVSF